jgi:4a-hydroxytetrahydrobiopterin dehydratase
MDEGQYRKLSRGEASAAVTELGWRYMLGEFRTEVLTGSLPLAADVAARAAAEPGADGHLRMDVRSDRVVLALQSAAAAWVTPEDVDLARRISAVAEEFKLTTRSGVGERSRSVQVLEIGIDAMDAAAIRPFWKAVLGYADEHDNAGPTSPLVDPLGEGPAIWFQQMDAPRPQRNRIHLDVSVPHDEHRRSGCSPTRRETRRASRPGRAGTRRTRANGGRPYHRGALPPP